MSFTLCTSGAIINKAGVNANSTAIASGALLSQISDEVEGEINALTHYDWVDNYASVKTNFKPILAAMASSLGGLKVIAYDPSGYTSRYEAQLISDILLDDYTRGLAALKDITTREKM